MDYISFYTILAVFILYSVGVFFWGYRTALKKAEGDILDLTRQMWQLKVELKELEKMFKGDRH